MKWYYCKRCCPEGVTLKILGYSHFLLRIALSFIFLFSSGLAIAEMTDAEVKQKIEQLEKEVVSLKKQTGKNKAANKRFKKKYEEYVDKLSIDGFLTAGLAQSNRNEVYTSGQSNDLSSLVRGKVGLQLDFQVTEKANAVVQLFGAASEDDWDLRTTWAYLNYDFSPRYSLLVGRFRFPAFMYSQQFSVGYSLPWVRPPIDSYRALPFNDTDGLQFTWRSRWGGWSTLTRFVYGNKDQSVGSIRAEQQNQTAIDFNISRDNWRMRLGYITEQFEYEDAELGSGIFVKDDGQFYSAGIGYDNGLWYVESEATRIKVGDGVIGDDSGYHIGAGYRIGKFTPYYLFSHTETKDDSSRPVHAAPGSLEDFTDNAIASLTNRQESTQMLGLRWDVEEGIDVKLQVSYVYNFKDTVGFFQPEFDSVGIPQVHDLESATIWELVIDAVF